MTTGVRLGTPRPWVAPALVAGGALGVCVAAALIDPMAPPLPLPGCPFLGLTGWFCPGCGSSRAIRALVSGDVARAAG